MAATTFRQDTRAILMTILTEQQTATPTLLRKVSAIRSGFNELPCAYISSLAEVITTDQGTRTRTMTPEITIVDNFREGNTADFDLIVDYLVDRLTDAYSRLGGSAIIGSQIIVNDVEVEDIGPERTTYRPAVVLSLPNTVKREGRL